MDSYIRAIDKFAVRLTQQVIKNRWFVIPITLTLALVVGSYSSGLFFSSNYREFFSEENPELSAFESFQATYTKNDNILFVLEPESGEVFEPDTLEAVRHLTESAWHIPYAIRVDSVSNFQSTVGTGDDLIVADLVPEVSSLSEEDILERRQIALAEPLLNGLLITEDASVTAINVVLQYPQIAETEVPEAVHFAENLRKTIEQEFSTLSVHLTGVSPLNNAFVESGMEDMKTLVPAMFLIILVITAITLRSFWGTVSTLFVIFPSMMVGMGFLGWQQIGLTPISGVAPVVILTLAIADSIHILVSLRSSMKDGTSKRDAIVEALRVNFMAVTITSATTIVGFLSLNFSDSPPFWHLGNSAAIGIGAAWFYSITLLPAIISVLPFRVNPRSGGDIGEQLMNKLADFVIRYRSPLLAGTSALAVLLVLQIPTTEFNDEFTKYFDERIEFRRDTDEAVQHFGMYPIEFSVSAADAGGISDPDYLQVLEEFTQFLRNQPEVVHVYSIADIMKRLNKNLHGDDSDYYRLPNDRDLSAQYLLLYEMSLPYGLDLNDRIDVSKSASRVTATLGNVSTLQTKEFLKNAANWLSENAPVHMQAKPTSAQVMFTYITDRNVQNMIVGSLVAVLAISVLLMLSLRSFSLGLLSLVPNGLPILLTFGAWAVLVGTVGFSVASIASISLGLIVDDSVHFLTKYLRARKERLYDVAESIRYSFRNVGVAIIVNTVILVSGFLVMTASSFKLNVDMGLMTALAIAFALILDFFLLPPLLLLGRDTKPELKLLQTQPPRLAFND